MLKCLATGGKGNLGASLQRIDGWQVLPVGREDWGARDEIFSRRPDLVVHAAGSLTKPANMHPADYIESNVLTLMQTLELMKKYAIPRLFFVSSCAVYGASSQTKETVALSPISLNGYAKLLCERMLAEYCKANQIDCVVLRVFNIFGGQDRFSVLHHLRKSLIADEPFRMNNNGRAQRDFVHVDDVAWVIHALAHVVDLPAVLNIGTGVAVKISEVVQRFRELNPALRVEEGTCDEVEYSRADITLLQSLVNCRFQSILDSIVEVQT